MSAEKLFSLRNRWFTGAVGITLTLAVVAALFGFLLLPSLQSNATFADTWDKICTAAGLVRPVALATQPVKPDFKTSEVIVTPQMMGPTDTVSIGRGATLALRCTMCHGARGLSEADSPNLASQYETAVYKQLQDYKTGARVSAVMSPRVTDLSDQDMRDLAAYFAYLPRLPGYHPTGDVAPPVIVLSGAPLRNIPPCGACHGTIDYKTGAAWLEGQSPVYLKAQLEAFAAGTRRNDISQQMRNIARNMTKDEIEAAAQFFSRQPPAAGTGSDTAAGLK
ncbi:MAG TPA: c-type cytochrome [Alphaproteobacteria bacterium]|nr:c-type cytochrome [Alphaproteobacteria bacterium]